MPSATYDKVLKTIGTFIEPDKADGVLTRHVKRANATADSFGPSEFKSSLEALVSAVTLYVPDAGKQAALSQKLRQLT